jgi:hypothetical protein
MLCFDHTETHRSNHSTKLLFTPTVFDHTVIWDCSTSHFLILLRFSILFLFMLGLRWNHSHFRRHFHHYLILQCHNRRGTLDSRIEQFPGHDHLLRQQRHTRLVFLVEVRKWEVEQSQITVWSNTVGVNSSFVEWLLRWVSVWSKHNIIFDCSYGICDTMKAVGKTTIKYFWSSYS